MTAKNEAFQYCMRQKPESLKKSPAPSHPTHVARAGNRKGTGEHHGQPGSGRQPVLGKVPIHAQVSSAARPPPPSWEDSSTFFILHGFRCATGCKAVVLDGGRRAEYSFHHTQRRLPAAWSNRQSQPKHPGSLGHLLPVGIRFAWPARETSIFNFINAINNPKDSAITFYALINFMHCSAQVLCTH